MAAWNLGQGINVLGYTLAAWPSPQMLPAQDLQMTAKRPAAYCRLCAVSGWRICNMVYHHRQYGMPRVPPVRCRTNCLVSSMTSIARCSVHICQFCCTSPPLSPWFRKEGALQCRKTTRYGRGIGTACETSINTSDLNATPPVTGCVVQHVALTSCECNISPANGGGRA